MKFLKKMFNRDPDKASQKKAAKAIKILGDDELANSLVYKHLTEREWLLDLPVDATPVGGISDSDNEVEMFFDEAEGDDLTEFDLEAHPIANEPQTIGDLIGQSVHGELRNGRR